MHYLFRHLPRFLRHLLLDFVEHQLAHLTDAEVAQGVDYVKSYILSIVAAELGL